MPMGKVLVSFYCIHYMCNILTYKKFIRPIKLIGIDIVYPYLIRVYGGNKKYYYANGNTSLKNC